MNQDILLLAGVYVIGFIFGMVYLNIPNPVKIICALLWPVIFPLFWIAVGIVALVKKYEEVDDE